MYFFFFKQKTAYEMRISDWSSNGCSFDLVWLGASAGTGKTQVLSARVLRLMLEGVSPEAILCITFTKAGAAEMAHRIHERLAMWVRMDDGDLRTELQALGLDLDLIGYDRGVPALMQRSEEHTSELQSLMRISYAVFCLKKKKDET